MVVFLKLDFCLKDKVNGQITISNKNIIKIDIFMYRVYFI